MSGIGLRALVDGRPAGRTGRFPADLRAPALPDADTPDMAAGAQDDADIFTATLVAIDYVDAAGAGSSRRITIRSIRDEGGHFAVGAVCHERRAFRRFRSDRIGELRDLSTGEIFDDAALFLRRHVLLLDDPAAMTAAISEPSTVPFRATRALLDRVRDELVLLAGLARTDGFLDEAETLLLYGHVLRRTLGDGRFDGAAIARFIAALVPDAEAVEHAAARFAAAHGHDSAVRETLFDTANELIMLDGVVTPEEAEWRDAVMAALDAQPMRGGVAALFDD
ncbi:MAG: WYL domain-containing protein [Vicinamibacterales bacterium]